MTIFDLTASVAIAMIVGVGVTWLTTSFTDRVDEQQDQLRMMQVALQYREVSGLNDCQLTQAGATTFTDAQTALEAEGIAVEVPQHVTEWHLEYEEGTTRDELIVVIYRDVSGVRRQERIETLRSVGGPHRETFIEAAYERGC